MTFLGGQPSLPGLPTGLPTGITAILTHDPALFEEVTGGQVPEWRAGVALPEEGTLVIPLGEGRGVADAETRRVLRHEWAHLGLHQSLPGLRIPRWFDEGYAQWASGGWEALDAWRLRVLLATGGATPLDSLTLAWPREREAARTAYLLSASAVTYLLGESGSRGLEIFLKAWRTERSFDTALRSTFGVTPGQFEDDWRRHVRKRYGWLFVLSHSAIFWLLMTLVLLVMARIRHRSNRERMARLRAGDVPDAPAYWEAGGGGAVDRGPQDGSKGVEGPP